MAGQWQGSFKFLLIAGMVVGGYFFWQNYDITGLNDVRIEPKAGGRAKSPFRTASNTHETPVRAASSIRIASFNLGVLDDNKLEKPRVMEVLAGILRQYDVVALQEIRSRSQDALPQLIAAINASGARYDYAIGPRLGRGSVLEQYAFVFDRATIEIDRNQLQTVGDPDDLLAREPLVGWFRVRGPPLDEAFTFSLVSFRIDPEDAPREIEQLGNILRSVRDDGRGEDDVILAGDFSADDQHLGQVSQSSEFVTAITRIPTAVRGGAQLDNLIFFELATKEFTGRSGVFDFLREYNFSVEEALEISDHLPVWGEFSPFEGGAPGRVAGRGGEPSAR